MPVERPQKAAEGRDSAAEGHGRKSAAVREQAILALLSERTLERAAKRCGVNERTLRRWLTDDPAFKAEYDAARRATFQAAMSRVATLTVRAVEALEELLADTRHPSVRLGAARTVAEIGMHQHDTDVIVRKLEEIEAAQERRARR
jgi:alpha-beta hydrolase superfamily lysophospholipase